VLYIANATQRRDGDDTDTSQRQSAHANDAADARSECLVALDKEASAVSAWTATLRGAATDDESQLDAYLSVA
jgi:hypothetical protein